VDGCETGQQVRNCLKAAAKKIALSLNPVACFKPLRLKETGFVRKCNFFFTLPAAKRQLQTHCPLRFPFLVRLTYINRQMAIMDYNTNVAYAREEGRQDEKERMVFSCKLIS